MRRFVGFDTETHRISENAPYPRAVVAAFSEITNGKAQGYLKGFHEPDFAEHMRTLLEDPDVHIIGHNTQYDTIVTACRYPELIEPIFKAYKACRIHDNIIQEKLLNLSDHGRITSRKLANGAVQAVRYTQADLEKRWLGIDRTDEKIGEDIWRLRFGELDGVPVESYPEQASKYAVEDAINALLIFLHQRNAAKQLPHLSLRTEEFHTYKHFCLGLVTAWGFATDQDHIEACIDFLSEKIQPENIQPLFKSGIFRPPVPPAPYKNGQRNSDGTPKMTQGKSSSKDMARLREIVESRCCRHGLDLVRTTGKKPQISTSAEVLDQLAPVSPVLRMFQHVQKMKKLVEADLPRLRGNPVIYANYDPIKETGRTSSFASKIYPSANIQQVPKKMEGVEIRKSFRAREGYVLAAVDYTCLELVSWAQTCWSLFGFSKMREILNQGIDPHAYLASVIASRKGVLGVSDYATFQALKSIPERLAEWSLYRTLAKPVGLGFPGRLGPKTLVRGPARAYGVRMTVDEARELREIWRATFPEQQPYFAYIDEHCTDDRNSGDWEFDEDWGKWVRNDQAYQYTSPKGMVRRGASYCAAANGRGLQTPAAEGAGLAIQRVSEAIWLNRDDPLYGVCRIVAFIHDELIVEIPDDTMKDLRARKISQHMVEGMREIMQDVKVQAEPSLMRRWQKCDPVYNEDGTLAVFEDYQLN